MASRDIIVIGASAGGLTVLQKVLSALPWDLPACVFVVLHTTQGSPGLLPQILNRCSRLPVLYAVHDAPVLPARVYVAPSGQRHMILDRGKVRLLPGPRENRSRPSIDALFRSASHAYGSRVIGVILTGNLDDGAAGMASITQRGGLTIAQDPEDADAPSMPSSAIEITEPNFILPAEDIGPKLADVAGTETEDNVQPISEGNGGLDETRQGYVCPECGGVLEEMHEGGMLRFRCRVGHMYSPESLMADQTESVERALWAAIRTLEEQAEFSERLASNSRKKQRTTLEQRFNERAQASREDAAALRDLLQKTSQPILTIPDEKTGTE